MKIKKLISSALVFVMLFTMAVAVLPVASSAEESKVELNVKGENPEDFDGETLLKIVKNYRLYGSTFENENGQKVKPFNNAREALDYELSMGYIDYVKYAGSAVYVNRYTGLMYFENTSTGQILTSNPYDPAYQTLEGGTSVSISDDKLSQLELKYFELANTSKTGDFNTLKWIEQNALAPKVSGEGSTISVTYTLGTQLTSFVAPGAMLYSRAIEKIIHPMFDSFAKLLTERCGEFNAAYAPTDNDIDLTSFDIKEHAKASKRLNSEETIYSKSSINQVIDAMIDYSRNYDVENGTSVSGEISKFGLQIKSFLRSYSFVDPIVYSDNVALADAVEAFKNGNVVMVMNGAVSGDIILPTLRTVDKALKATCPNITEEMIKGFESECGYTPVTVDVPKFNVTLCYTIDDNGDLLVSVPANSINYATEIYALKDITPLKYFGAGDMDKDGYVFFPDGSGTIVEFDDFYFGSDSDKTSVAITLGEGIPMYGADYCYAKITGQHREQLVMPVYGLVNESNSTGNGYSSDLSKVTNGFFAVIEEGSSLANLTYLSGGGTHKYISVYSQFKPFPTDTYDLSQSISVSGLGSYTTATAARFEGSITTRYTMLVDHSVYEKAVSADASFSGFLADYVGMATCYRSYLERNDVIELLKDSDVLADIPLYIEALGSIDVTKKILSFPVTVSEPLTSFEDVELMYKELSDAITTLNNKAAECDAVVAEILKEDHPELRQGEIDQNRALAAKYRELAKNVENIKNINFKLTGFANGGMHSTYPSKLKWESSVGGKRGFNTLLANAKSASAAVDSNFGVYPDFDFMYINNTAAFDGIARRSNSAFMVDNRYASKQEYDSVNQEFETMFALVIASDSLDSLYTKFDKKYSKFGAETLSVSTLTSDLNSDFNKKDAIVREKSLNNVTALLERMSSSYKLMGEKGNIYTVKYLDHILRAPIDSSHYNVTSYTVPFYGMVLHGYINYTGAPLNYSGSPEYDILRSIENGASLYYILCMQNTNYLKDDPLLSDYFGVDYNNWFEKIVAQYKILNDALGDLQTYKIVDHDKIIAERVIDSEEMSENYRILINEFAQVVDEQISQNIDIAIKSMRDEGKLGEGLKFEVSDDDFNEILEVFAERANLSVEVLCEEYDFDKVINAVIEKYASQYSNGSVSATVNADDVNDYKSTFEFITDSSMLDENYVVTDFTCDNGNVVMVTYEKDVNGNKETVVFLLNYNVFSVKIKLDGLAKEKLGDLCDEDGCIILDKYDFIKG